MQVSYPISEENVGKTIPNVLVGLHRRGFSALQHLVRSHSRIGLFWARIYLGWGTYCKSHEYCLLKWCPQLIKQCQLKFQGDEKVTKTATVCNPNGYVYIVDVR